MLLLYNLDFRLLEEGKLSHKKQDFPGGVGQGCQMLYILVLPFWNILEGLGMKILYGHLEYFIAILYILWSFGIFLVYFARFGMFFAKKNLATLGWG
jgi:hypothetical protein